MRIIKLSQNKREKNNPNGPQNPPIEDRQTRARMVSLQLANEDRGIHSLISNLIVVDQTIPIEERKSEQDDNDEEYNSQWLNENLSHDRIMAFEYPDQQQDEPIDNIHYPSEENIEDRINSFIRDNQNEMLSERNI